MPETAILNKSVEWDKELADSIGPDYGWEQMRQSQLAFAKPAFGDTWSRIVGNGGHSTQFSWAGRSRNCIEYLKRWAQQYERGFFTMIDHDGRGRHYVGRFVGDMPLSQAGNDKYNISGWTFVELPRCPMLKYPSDWRHWSVSLSPFDDWGKQEAASGATLPGAWVQPAAVADDFGVMRAPLQLQNVTPVAGDFVTFEYLGYGFQLWAGQGTDCGICTIEFDGEQIATVDLYNAKNIGALAQPAFEKVDAPLDIHRVKIIASATKNPLSMGTRVLVAKLQVMR